MSLNPWLALILGVLFGWFFGWLLERWFFRRRRAECEEQLQRVEGELLAQEDALNTARIRAGALEADIAALKLTAEASPVPTFEVVAPSIEAQPPEVELEAQKVGVELPEAVLPEVEIEAPAVQLGAALPEVSFPEVGAPQVTVELPEAALPEVEVEMPRVGLGLPEAVLPALKVEAPEAAVELPAAEALKAEVDWPALAVEAGKVEVEAPELSGSAPSIGAELPSVGPGLPETSVEVLAPTPGAKADDLARIRGIGPKFAAQLSAAGITSFAALAASDPAHLRAVINAPEWRQVDYGAWVAEAQTLAAAAPQATGDDLTLLEGIGPAYSARLNAAGIGTFAALAAVDEAHLAEIVGAPAWRKVNYGEWIAQARLAATGDEAGLSELQARLFSRKGDNLTLVSGVGDRAADALSAAGITSFAALAAASPEHLSEITRTAGVRGGDFSAWIAEAGLRAAGKRISKPKQTRAARAVSCPQDLSRVKGIGAVFETRLYAAGIGTFWELSQASNERLMEILEIQDFQKIDLEALKTEALRLAEETGTLARTWDGTPPDDFEPFEGIGEVYEGRLYDAGICTYRALANATVEQLAEICKAPEWRRPDYASWIAQAERLSGIAE